MFQLSKVLLHDINIDFSHYTNSPPIVVSNIQKYKHSIYQAKTNGISVHYKNVKLESFIFNISEKMRINFIYNILPDIFQLFA